MTMRPFVFAGFLLALGCSSPAEETSVEVDQVTFSPGCGVKQETDCSFGFVMTYVENHANVIVSHLTDNTAHTDDITVEGQGFGSGATMGHAVASLGLLDVKVGQTYAVTVYDPKHAVLWSGKVDTLYHL